MGRSKVNHYYIPAGEQEEKIDSMLKMLDLSAASLSFRQSGDLVREKHGSMYDFLENILEKEVVWREDRRITRWMQQARFRFKATLEEFDFPFQPTIDRRVINELRSCRFIKQREHVIFLGHSGVGKTHLAIGLGVEAISKGYETRFVDLRRLLELVEKQDEFTLTRLLRSFMLPKLLILDEMDHFETGKNGGTFLFKLLKDRTESDTGLSTIITSNKTFEEWESLFGDKKRAIAVLDRLVGKATIINITGPSYRDKVQRKKITTSKFFLEPAK